MQHYLAYGIGFPSSVISPPDWEKFVEAHRDDTVDFLHLNPSEEDFSFTIVPATDDSHDIDICQGYSSIVLLTKEECEEGGKVACFDRLQRLHKAYFPLNTNNKEKILTALKKYGLEKYIDKVQPIVYSNEY